MQYGSIFLMLNVRLGYNSSISLETYQGWGRVDIHVAETHSRPEDEGSLLPISKKDFNSKHQARLVRTTPRSPREYTNSQ